MEKLLNTELTNRLKTGDPKAFEILFSNWFEPLVNFSVQYIRDPEVARNIVQTIFMKVWEKRQLINEELNIKSYLFTATKNDCLSYLRHLRIENRYFETTTAQLSDYQLNYEALEQLSFDPVDLENIDRIIRDTVRQLPERCREVFIMSRYEDMRNKEIAEKLNISVKAVEANISRALKALRENLRDYLPVLIAILQHYR